MKEGKHKKESVFELNGGMPPLGQALPLAFQHIVAMIVMCDPCHHHCGCGRFKRGR